jgi:hypothetical protein
MALGLGGFEVNFLPEYRALQIHRHPDGQRIELT